MHSKLNKQEQTNESKKKIIKPLISNLKWWRERERARYCCVKERESTTPDYRERTLAIYT